MVLQRKPLQRAPVSTLVPRHPPPLDSHTRALRIHFCGLHGRVAEALDRLSQVVVAVIHVE